MIPITPDIHIDENELAFTFIRSSGPGGQHVNKVATAVQLRFDVRSSPNLPEHVKERLRRLAGRKMTEDGILIILARRFRSQDGNRRDAVERLIALIEKATHEPRPRQKTRQPKSVRLKIREAKQRRGIQKGLRRRVSGDEDR